MTDLPDGLNLVVKRDCPTCAMLGPVFGDLASGPLPVAVYSQDDPGFPAEIPAVVNDTSLERSFRLGIETMPTLIRVEQGRQSGSALGRHRQAWRALPGLYGLGDPRPQNPTRPRTKT